MKVNTACIEQTNSGCTLLEDNRFVKGNEGMRASSHTHTPTRCSELFLTHFVMARRLQQRTPARRMRTVRSLAHSPPGHQWLRLLRKMCLRKRPLSSYRHNNPSMSTSPLSSSLLLRSLTYQLLTRSQL
mmetsp:Transcript_120742/g.189389  ORF Transcript_120742/g.189389 Transcript_120742/m.189389 type:complete len:129 (+) Transcript_120742:84-470(+)